jgi:hypothetical protein
MYKIPFLYDYVFANIVLPNALSPELAMMSYMHTQYTNKYKSTDFLEAQFGYTDQTLAGYVFDNALGLHPNSVSNSNIFSHCYKDYLLYEEDSVFYGKKKYNKYIYPIRINAYIDSFVGSGHPGQKINGEFFWKNMSAEALKDAQEGRAIIFLDYGQENYLTKETIEAFHDCLERAGIPGGNIIFAINSFNAEQVYDEWFPGPNKRFEMHSWPYVAANVSYHYNTFPDQHVSISNFNDSRNTIRDNHFLFPVRRPRDHRVAMLFALASDGVLEKSDWSCLTPFDYSEHIIDQLEEKYQTTYNREKLKEICSILPKTLTTEGDRNYRDYGPWSDNNSLAYENSYFYICTETYTEGPFRSLTEKVFKPIVNFQPFFMVAYPGALALLRELGFKTFSEFINESYDVEPDTTRRIAMIVKEVEKLAALSPEEMHKLYWAMEDILIHNYKHFLSHYKNDEVGKKFIEYLHKRISE